MSTGSKRQEEKLYQEWLELRKRIRTSTAINSRETSEEKRARIHKLTRPGNEEEFCKYYFPHYISSDFGWFHHIMFEHVEEANSFNVWELPREHAKSVFADVFVPCLKIARGELDGFILASENETKAKVLISDLEAELRDNDRFISDFFEGKDAHIYGSWLSGHFSFGDGIGVWAFGLGQNPAGVRKGEKRPNLGVIDDADSKKKYQKNQVRLKEDLDWCLGEFLGCLQIESKTFIFANNRVAKNGLTAHMVGDVEEGDAKREGMNHLKVFATEHPHTHEMLSIDDGGVPAWKERFTIAQLSQRFSEMGYRNTQRQMYHRHIEDGNIFAPEDLPWHDLPTLDQYEQLLTYCDPSWKDSKKSDFKAIVLLGQIGRYTDVIDCWVRQDSRSNMVKAQYDMHEYVEEEFKRLVGIKGSNCKVRRCKHYMEANMLQDLLLDEYYLEGDNRGYYLPIFKDERQKPDKFGRIEDLQPRMSRGLIRFNAEKRKSPDMRNLRDQFLAFPNGHDDGPDALEGGDFKFQLTGRTKRFGVHTQPRKPKYGSF